MPSSTRIHRSSDRQQGSERAPAKAQALRTLAAATAILAAAALAPAVAAPLSFSAYANVYGYVSTQYTSPLLGDVSFTLNGPGDYKNNYSGSGALTTGVASVNYALSAGSAPGFDPLYDIITNSGQYGFNYAGQAEVRGLRMHTKIEAGNVDLGGAASSPNSQVSAYAYTGSNQQFFIGATAARPTGSYGAILVGLTLDGGFPTPGNPAVSNNASASNQVNTSFIDTAGVSYQSSFYLSTYAGDPNWSGSSTAYKKLLFQYGTPFSINMYQSANAYTNGSANFFNTGYISSLELPFGATLDSGAQQAGLGSLSDLYGHVTNSATVDALNTNWDFGSNGGGFTPPVPEPSSYALMLAGLAAVSLIARRKIRRAHG